MQFEGLQPCFWVGQQTEPRDLIELPAFTKILKQVQDDPH